MDYVETEICIKRKLTEIMTQKILNKIAFYFKTAPQVRQISASRPIVHLTIANCLCSIPPPPPPMYYSVSSRPIFVYGDGPA